MPSERDKASENPYESNLASSDGTEKNRRSRIEAGAILKAVAIAFLASLAIGALVGFVGFILAVANVLTEDMVENSLLLSGFLFCLCLVPNALGGFLAAKFAGRDEVLHGIAAGTALFALSAVLEFLPDDDPFALLYLIVIVPLSAAGAFIAKIW